MTHQRIDPAYLYAYVLTASAAAALAMATIEWIISAGAEAVGIAPRAARAIGLRLPKWHP